MPTTPEPQRRILRVQDPAAIKFLTNVSELRYLKPFMNHERTLASVAEELNVDLSGLVRKVKRMMAMNLLEVTRSGTRFGKPIKFYASTADEFFLPESENAVEWALTQTESLLNQRLEKAVARVWLNRQERNESDWGVRVFCRDGAMCASLALRPNENWTLHEDDAVMVHFWRLVEVSPADARWFASELKLLCQALLNREAAVADQPKHLLRMSFVADPPE